MTNKKILEALPTVEEELNGLSKAQVKEKINQGKVNNQIDANERTFKDIVKDNVFTYFNLIFTILAALVIIAGQYRSLTFMIAIVSNTIVGIVQEYRAKRVLDKINVLNQPYATAIRDGEKQKINITSLVEGDVIILEAGSQIPADAVVINGTINVNESLLTGESDEIEKKENSELMSGSFVVSGKCYAKLTKVGAESYISKLTIEAKSLSSNEQSEMIRDIDLIIKIAGIAIIPVGVFLFIKNFFWSGNSFGDSINSMVAAVVGMVPEGLYLLVTVRLALSAIKLAKNQVILHSMKSIETLARVDILCVDKTGTITTNEMKVVNFINIKEGAKELVSKYINVLPDNNATMEAMRNYFNTKKKLEHISFTPFSSKYKYSRVVTNEGEYRLGAYDILLKEDALNEHKELIDKYQEDGIRILAFVKVEEENQLLGLVALENTIRDDAVHTFNYFKSQEVDVIVISGDNPVTVSQIAKRAGIDNAGDYVNAVELKNREMIREALLTKKVFGRVTPDQKKMIVEELKSMGHTVAMTGDGVNDILAMKEADCSIAMGSGSEAAMQASQVVLLDSDFSHMTQIVSEGRQDINNIERSASLFLVKNIFSLLLGIFSIIMLSKYPLKPEQVSLISGINIGIPAFLLALEKNYKRQGKHFLRRVMFKALPAAITNFVLVAALALVGEVFEMTDKDISVAATFLMATVGFLILHNISRPMNKYRISVIVACILMLIFASVFLNNLFSISLVSKKAAIILALFIICTEPFVRYLTKLCLFIERKVNRQKDIG